MCITGSLADFSLPEILYFIEKGHKTGLVTLLGKPTSEASSRSRYYIWVHQGCLVAGAKRLDEQGLVKLINHHKWASPRVVTKLAQLCPSELPLGLHLKNQGVLRSSHLKQLFFVQVLQPVCASLQLREGEFSFEQNLSLPMREMTGLRLSAGIPVLSSSLKETKNLNLGNWKPHFTATRVAKKSGYSGKVGQSYRGKGIPENGLASVFA
ncbi:MAG TPA: DUF4388 domain-containing protein [Chroococcales cyanobacterium]